MSKVALILFLTMTLGATDVDEIRYDVKAENIHWGVIGSKGHAMDGLWYFPLDTADGRIDVQLGPCDFVDNSGFVFRVGEIVSVIGMPAVIGEHEVLIAREVQSMTAVLVLRNRKGEPMWTASPPIQMDPEKPRQGGAAGEEGVDGEEEEPVRDVPRTPRRHAPPHRPQPRRHRDEPAALERTALQPHPDGPAAAHLPVEGYWLLAARLFL